MRRVPHALAALVLLAGPALTVPPAYEAIRDARPDGRTLAVDSLVLERDVFTFRLGPGTLHFLAPAGDQTFGAVWIGPGTMELKPATEGERRYLAQRVGQPDLAVLSETFDSAVFLFADGTWKELQGKGTVASGTPDARAKSVFEEFDSKRRKTLHVNATLALLAAMTGSTGIAAGPFYAWMDGKPVPLALASVQPLGTPGFGAEESSLVAYHPQRGGVYYSSHLKSEIASGAAASCGSKPVVDAAHYILDTRVRRNADLDGEATIRFSSLVDGLTVLPFDLAGTLRIASAVRLTKEGDAVREVPLAVIQERREEDDAPAVVFPDPIKGGEEATIRIRYAGDKVLVDDGDGNFRVEARDAWYPNLNPGLGDDTATFDLTFHVPAKKQLVSVGSLVSSHEEGGQTVSVWKADKPLRVAGFNYGTFKVVEKKEPNTGVLVRVYTNPGTPDVINEINEALRSANTMTAQQQMDLAAEGGGYNGGLPSAPTGVSLSTEMLADAAMADATNAVQVYSKFFGPLGADHVALTQQSQWTFGQSWPGLVFLPFLAALDGTTRQNLGLPNLGEFVDQVALHEMAHQWWGHRVGWASYRDQWLSEGFAEFSAALALQLTRGRGAYDQFWETRRRNLLTKTRLASIRNADAGPIALGWRLSSDLAPSAYDAVVYGKGAYVLHMLRAMMRENGPDPDKRFFDLLRDFVTTYDGRNATTEDFKHLLEEKHMVPEINATRDGKMDWFFDEWVYGTEIPRYETRFEIEKAEGGKYHVHGTVTQSGVSDRFLALVPLYFEMGKGQYLAFARAPFKGTMTKTIDTVIALPGKPKRVVANVQHEVLAEN